MGCLDDNLAVDFASGSLRGPAAVHVERHLASCRDCRTLVATLAPAPGERDSDLATAPRRGGRGSEPGHGEHGHLRGSDPAVAVGDTIGRYVVLRRLGSGGMGVVYAAYDPQLDRKIALKLLRTGIGLGQREAQARLVREAQAIARLNHPNVVAVYDVGTAGDDLYIAMEFVEGDTLSHWLKRWERPWSEVVAMFVEAGRGLAAAHAVGLLHRDFKPDNVLVGADGRVRVSDFGLARSAVTDDEAGPALEASQLRTPLTGTGAVMGTPRYMAPEQLRGHGVTAAADQFSFCVALYEALYGQHPLAGETAAEMAERGARMAPPPPSSVVAPAIATVLARGLDPQPARRFPSMTALLEVLIPPSPRPRPRRMALVLAGSVSLVLAGAAAAMVLRPGGRRDDAEVRELKAQIVALSRERDDVARTLELLRSNAAQEDNSRQVAVLELERQVDERDRKIAQLEGKLAEVVAGPAPVALARPRANPIDRGLATAELNVVAQSRRADVQGCFAEWAERTGRATAVVKVAFKVPPDGRVRRADVTGLTDEVVPECVAALFRGMRFPARDLTTVVTADVGFVEGKTTITTSRVGTEEPAPLIDSPGQ